MIKATFYNLPHEKRQRLFEAARKEFSKTDFHDASINRIIKDAEISRGSFYTYFDDKYDLVRALLEDYFKMIQHQVNTALESSNGDVFEMFISLFDTTVSFDEIRDNMATFGSLFRALQVSDTEPQTGRIIDKQRHVEQQEEMFKRINRDMLMVNSDEDLTALLDLLFFISRKAMIKALSPNSDIPAIHARLRRQFEFLKNGVVKPEYRKQSPTSQ